MLKEIDLENEKSSPYFLVHKELCEEFENEINEANGSVHGTYGAWSFYCEGNFETAPKSKVSLLKSPDKLDAYSMFQNIYSLSEWTIESPMLNFLSKGRKSNFLDNLGLSSYKKLFPKFSYHFKTQSKNQSLVKSLLSCIEALLQQNEVDSFRIEDGVLTLKFESNKAYLNQLLEMRKLLKIS